MIFCLVDFIAICGLISKLSLIEPYLVDHIVPRLLVVVIPDGAFLSDDVHVLLLGVTVQVGIQGHDVPVRGLLCISVLHITEQIAQLKEGRHVGIGPLVMPLVDVEVTAVIRLTHSVHYVVGCTNAPREVRTYHRVILFVDQLVPIL